MKNVLFFIGDLKGTLTVLVRLRSMWFAFDSNEDFYGVDLTEDKSLVVEHLHSLIADRQFVDKVCADAIQGRGWTYQRYLLGTGRNAVPIVWAKSYQQQVFNTVARLEML